MNKKHTTKLTVKALLLIGAVCGTHNTLFAPPKKNVLQINKKESSNKNNEDFFKTLENFDKKNKSTHEEQLKVKKEQELNEKKMQELKKEMAENTWTLKDYCIKQPLSFYNYHKMLCDTYTLFEIQYETIATIEKYYKYCVKKYSHQQEIIKAWDNAIYFNEYGNVLLDLSKTIDRDNIANINIHKICHDIFENGIPLCHNDYFKTVKKIFKLYEHCDIIDTKTKELAKKIFKLILYTKYKELQATWCTKKDFKLKNTLKDIEQLNFKVRSKLFIFLGNMIDILNQDTEAAVKFGKDITLETNEKLQKEIKEARRLKTDLSTPLRKEIQRCNFILEKLEQLNNNNVPKQTKKSKIVEERTFEKNKENIVEKEYDDSESSGNEEYIENESLENEKTQIIEEQNPPYSSEHPRVTEWFTDPAKRLDEDYTNCGEAVKKLMIKFHAFTKKVDSFILPLATQCNWLKNNKHVGSLSYNIPAEIIDHDTNKRYIGIFSYGVNKDGLLFHRCFSEKLFTEIEDIMRKCHETSLYPSIEEVKNLKNLEYIGFQSTKNVTVKQNSLMVEITDKPNNMVIKLCIPMDIPR